MSIVTEFKVQTPFQTTSGVGSFVCGKGSGGGFSTEGSLESATGIHFQDVILERGEGDDSGQFQTPNISVF